MKKAIANLGQSIPKQDKQLILNTLSTLMDIKVMELNIENGTLFIQYQNGLALELMERKLSKIGHPVISYIYPEVRPLNFDGKDPDHGSLA